MTDAITTNAYSGRDVAVALPKTISIPKGVILRTAPVKIVHHALHYELLIGVGKDHTAKLIIDEEALSAMTALEPEVTII